MPSGKLMIEESISRLSLLGFSKIVVVCLREHLEEYLSPNSFELILQSMGGGSLVVETCILDEPTKSQAETVAKAITCNHLSGAIFVKDCDNVFECEWSGGNQIAVLDLNKVGLIDAKNKSYVIADKLGNISNIVEKQVISNYFCCGGYGFSDANLFVTHFDLISSQNTKQHEIYISHVIFSMLMDGVSFNIGHASSYSDWGTIREYRHYMRSFITLFCDVDGVLFENGSKFGKSGWATDPIKENLEMIAKLKAENRLYLIITSSRPEAEIEYIKTRLFEFGVFVDRFIMGLPHTRRMLVNDYSESNPYPSATSINLERGSRVLSSILGSISA